ncbi:MAG: hypothetical protein Q4E35_08815 [Eubacteriales bacterium]|nr:hypothetical protein [Eubacteriales bacterium]
MWDNSGKKRKLVNVLLIIITIPLIIWLVIAIREAQEKMNSEDSVLMEVYQQQQQEQTQARKKEDQKIVLEYQKDMETVQKYLPGIICWGDILTKGTSGNVSFPDVLQDMIDENLCDVYQLSKAFDDTAGFSKYDWSTFKLKIPVVNMGSGDENSYTVLGRSGVVPFVIDKEFTIPAGTEKVGILIRSESGSDVTPMTGGSEGINNVFIDGIEGELSIEADAQRYTSSSYYYFNRIKPGKEVTVPKGTKIITDATDKYKDYIHVVWIGTYGNYKDTNDLIEQIKTLLARQTNNSDRYIVLGLCSSNGKWYFGGTYFDIMDSAMIQAFGDRYINVRKYLISDGCVDAGIEPTSSDRKYMESGVIPASFQSNSGNSELTASAYELIGNLVFDRMDKLGYFDEVREELKIDKNAAELLKAQTQ